MSYKVGDVFYQADGSIEVIARCPFCGDTQKQGHGHLSINVSKGLYYCYRCGAGGKVTELPRDVIAQVNLVVDQADEDRPVQDKKGRDIVYFPGPALKRPSALDRFHTEMDGEMYDVFELRNVFGGRTGVVLRSVASKRMYTYGDRTYLYPGRALVKKLGNECDVFYVVEGPYDVLAPCFVALAGLPDKRQVHGLSFAPLVLIPDGDVWTRKDLYRQYLRMWSKHPHIVDVIYLDDGTDPDDYTVDELMMLPRMSWREFEAWETTFIS